MIYEITGFSHISLHVDVDGIYDNPKSVKSDLEFLRRQVPGITGGIVRDGVQITDCELDADIESHEIETVREEGCRLPATYRRGYGTRQDDVAAGADGSPKRVWGPDNPEDRYDQ